MTVARRIGRSSLVVRAPAVGVDGMWSPLPGLEIAR
jgi:hypothetical protein